MTQTVHIVDDDPHIRDVIRFALEDAGYVTVDAEHGRQALLNLSKSPSDLVVLDIGMPEMDGFQTCKQIRTTSQVPILFLTARNDEIDRVLAFELGGDDYLAKPFSPRELVLRVQAILKRGKPEALSKLIFADLSIEEDKHLVTLGSNPLELTAREFGLLKVLAKHPDQVFPKATLIDKVYGDSIYVSDRTLDSHVRNLRAKARAVGCEELISTVHGVGLKLGECKC